MKDRESVDIRKRSIFSSSAESLTSFDDSLSINTQEQLYENIRLHKEIIQSVKLQPWSLSKKYKIVQKAKQYVSRHEDTLQERFALSGNTKDLYARFKILLADVSMQSGPVRARGGRTPPFLTVDRPRFSTRLSTSRKLRST